MAKGGADKGKMTGLGPSFLGTCGVGLGDALA